MKDDSDPISKREQLSFLDAWDYEASKQILCKLGLQDTDKNTNYPADSRSAGGVGKSITEEPDLF
jgi:hypothetical protein